MNVVAAYNDNARRDLQMVATLGSYIANFAGMGRDKSSMVKPSDLIPEAFSDGGIPSREWLEKQYERHHERLEREQNEKS